MPQPTTLSLICSIHAGKIISRKWLYFLPLVVEINENETIPSCISHRACLEIKKLCSMYFVRRKYKIQNYRAVQFGVAVKLWNCIRGDLSSHLGKDTDYYDWGFSWFSLVLAGQFQSTTSIRLRPFPSKSSHMQNKSPNTYPVRMTHRPCMHVYPVPEAMCGVRETARGCNIVVADTCHLYQTTSPGQSQAAGWPASPLCTSLD
jgi:hypothetical protein